MEKNEINRELKFFILIFSICRAFLLYIPITAPELPKIVITIESELTGNSLNFSGLVQLQLAVFLSLFSNSIVGVRLGFLCYEIPSIVILYKFTRAFQLGEFYKSPEEASQYAIIVVYVFAFFPHEIYNYCEGVKIISLFFVLSTLYAYYHDKITLASDS